MRLQISKIVFSRSFKFYIHPAKSDYCQVFYHISVTSLCELIDFFFWFLRRFCCIISILLFIFLYCILNSFFWKDLMLSPVTALFLHKHREKNLCFCDGLTLIRIKTAQKRRFSKTQAKVDTHKNLQKWRLWRCTESMRTHKTWGFLKCCNVQ